MRELSAPKFEFAKSNEELDIRDVTVIMPVAGKGTRAREVTNDIIPKSLIELESNKTILDAICENLQTVGFRNFVFCVGHHKDQIIDHVSQERWIHAQDVVYRFSEEDELSGYEGAVLNAVETFNLAGQAMVIPGDMLHDWEALVEMNREHKRSGAGITLGTTSHITEKTSDIGKLIVEEDTARLLWAYGRDDEPLTDIKGTANLTSIGVNVIDIQYFQELCAQFLDANPHERQNIGLRDTVGPWAMQSVGLALQLHAYDTLSEQVDMGTPDRIHYGQVNWRTLNSRQRIDN